MATAPDSSVTHRAARGDDLGFLLRLRTLTMAVHQHNSGATETPEQQRARVLSHYECAEILEVEGAPIGLWKVVRSPAEWKLVQVQLLPSHQGVGIGSSLVRSLVAEAKARAVPVSLNVLRANPARRLYERLGFRVVAETEHAYHMRFEG